MKKIVLMMFAVAFMLLAFTTISSAQKKMVVKVESKAVDANRGANPHIKSEAPTTDKVEEKIRGGCKINVKNYTGYFIKMYIDGKYQSTLSPWADCTVTMGGGSTTLYCISAGGTLEWETNCSCDWQFNFRLYP